MKNLYNQVSAPGTQLYSLYAIDVNVENDGSETVCGQHRWEAGRMTTVGSDMMRDRSR